MGVVVPIQFKASMLCDDKYVLHLTTICHFLNYGMLLPLQRSCNDLATMLCNCSSGQSRHHSFHRAVCLGICSDRHLFPSGNGLHGIRRKPLQTCTKISTLHAGRPTCNHMQNGEHSIHFWKIYHRQQLNSPGVQDLALIFFCPCKPQSKTESVWCAKAKMTFTKFPKIVAF